MEQIPLDLSMQDQPMNPSPPMSSPTHSSMPAPTPAAPQPQPSSTPNKLVPVIMVALVVLLAGGAAYAYFAGLIPGLGNKPPTLEDIAARSQNVNTGHVDMAFSLSVEPREASTKVFDQSVFESKSRMNNAAMRMDNTSMTGEANPKSLLMDESDLEMPADDAIDPFGSSMVEQINPFEALSPGLDSHVGFSTSQDFAKDENGFYRSSIQFQGEYSASGTNLKASGTLIALPEALFVQLKTIPTLFFDPSPILNTWIRIPTNGSLLDVYGPPEEARVFEPNPSDSSLELTVDQDAIRRETDLFAKELLKGGVVSLGKASKGELNGDSVWMIPLALHPEEFVRAYNSAYDRRATLLAGIEHPIFLTESMHAAVNEPQLLQILSEINNHLSLSIAVNQKSHQIVQMKSEFITAIEEPAKYKDVQWHATYVMTSSKQNEPITIDAPTESFSLRDVFWAISGTSPEEQLIETQVGIVRDLRNALASYQRKNGAYPESLTDLIGTEASYYGTVAKIPQDLFANGQPFGYIRTEDDYELTYQLRLPTDYAPSYGSAYAEGTNTATSASLSMEGEALRDTDGDGLNDAEEARYGTSEYLKDTDYDGFSDKEEIDGGYDPLTNSETGRYYGENDLSPVSSIQPLNIDALFSN